MRLELVCQTHDVDWNDAKGFESSIGSVVIMNKEGMFYAYHNRCPHLGISLELLEDQFMDADKQFIMCANHGALFEPDTGRCIFGPCAGQFLDGIETQIHSDGGVYLVHQ